MQNASEAKLAHVPGTEWTSIWAKDPPPPPPGYRLEVEHESFTGYLVAYRFVPEVAA